MARADLHEVYDRPRRSLQDHQIASVVGVGTGVTLRFTLLRGCSCLDTLKAVPCR